jgi:hypothetical protein
MPPDATTDAANRREIIVRGAMTILAHVGNNGRTGREADIEGST